VALQNIVVPHIRAYDFGVGVDRLSGAALDQVVKPTPSPPTQASGATHSFDVSRISSTSDLQQKLGIDIEASAGCAAFGASASGRFGYMQQSAVHSSTLFITITATIKLADLSIDESVLTDPAAQVAHDTELFATRYGDMFCRACSRGGLFVGVMRVETFDSTEANSIEAELKGSYGFFSADAKTNFSSVTAQHNVNVFCTIYSEGGTAPQIHDPTDPTELLEHANQWITAMQQDPDHNSVPYEWTLSPVAIAEGPPPLNAAQIEHAQDVLQACAQERIALLDEFSTFSWYRDHAEKYDWTTTAVTQDAVAAAAKTAQVDLDLVARCASAAIDDAAQAVMPATFAAAQNPPVPYRASPPPSPLPGPKSQNQIPVVSLIGLRVLVINKAVNAPQTSYSQYQAEVLADMEPGSEDVLPSRDQFDFIVSGIKITYDMPGLDTTAEGVRAFRTRVVAQEPASATVATGATVLLNVKIT
jgi:hypothetical protein